MTYYDKSMDRDKPPIGRLRIVQVRPPRWKLEEGVGLGFCDCGTRERPCMAQAVVMLADDDNHAFLLCEQHELERWRGQQ